MPVARRLSNVMLVTNVFVRTFSLLPNCFIAGLKYIAAVLLNTHNHVHKTKLPHCTVLQYNGGVFLLRQSDLTVCRSFIRPSISFLVF